MNNMNMMNNNPMMNMNNPMMMNMNSPMVMNMNNPMMMDMNNPMMNMNMMNMMNNAMMNMNMMNLYQNNLSNSGNFSDNKNSSTKKNKSSLGRLPRDQVTTNYTPFIQDNNGINFNIVFSTPSGNKTIIKTPVNIKVNDLLYKYMEKIGLGPNLIGNGIYFLYDGRKLKDEDYNILVKNCFQDGAHIIVLDAGNLIGANI